MLTLAQPNKFPLFLSRGVLAVAEAAAIWCLHPEVRESEGEVERTDVAFCAAARSVLREGDNEGRRKDIAVSGEIMLLSLLVFLSRQLRHAFCQIAKKLAIAKFDNIFRHI